MLMMPPPPGADQKLKKRKNKLFTENPAIAVDKMMWELMTKSVLELQNLVSNPYVTALEQTIASGILTAISSGKLKNLEILFNRKFGRPGEMPAPAEPDREIFLIPKNKNNIEASRDYLEIIGEKF